MLWSRPTRRRRISRAGRLRCRLDAGRKPMMCGRRKGLESVTCRVVQPSRLLDGVREEFKAMGTSSVWVMCLVGGAADWGSCEPRAKSLFFFCADQTLFLTFCIKRLRRHLAAAFESIVRAAIRIPPRLRGSFRVGNEVFRSTKPFSHRRSWWDVRPTGFPVRPAGTVSQGFPLMSSGRINLPRRSSIRRQILPARRRP